MMDGCTYFGAYVRVILPISLPGIAAVAVFTFLNAWNDFLWASLLLSSGDMKTIQVGLGEFASEGGAGQYWNAFMAACVASTLPALILFFFVQRWLVGGLIAGAVKSCEYAVTKVSIQGEMFLIDGVPTHHGRYWKGHKVEGLLFNNRVVQAIFDDENSETAHLWVYPDTGVWDPERNLSEFCAALPAYKAHGCDAVTINLQGGMPITKTETVQPWLNTAIDPEGNLKPAYMGRLARLLSAADAAGIVVIVGLYYFGQDKYINDEEAVKAGVVNAVDWLLETGHKHLLIEINNETDIPHYKHAILGPERIHELIVLARSRMSAEQPIPTTTSFAGGAYHMGFAEGGGREPHLPGD